MEEFKYSSVNYYSAGVVLAVTLLVYLINKYTYWTQRGVIQDTPVPILGNFAKFVFFQKSLSDIAEDIYNKYSFAPYVGAYLFNNHLLVVRDPEIVKCVLTKDFNNFHSRGLNVDRNDKFSYHLVFSEGDYWKIWRQNLTPIFTSAKMKSMMYLMVECSRRLSSYLESLAVKNKKVDIRKMTSDFTLEVIGSCAFGLQMNSQNEESNAFREISRKFFETSLLRSVREFLRFAYPSLHSFLHLKATDPTIEKFMCKLFTEMSDSRKGKPPIRHDFIDLMMDMRSRGFIEGNTFERSTEKKKLEIEDIHLASQSVVFLAAGFETSSTTMSFALYELAKNRNIQAKLRAEIKEQLQLTNGEITYELLSRLLYLDMVIDETLRMYPVLGVLDRECTADYKIPNYDLVLKKGTHIHIPAKALQYDPQYYDNPEQFNPDNFLPDVKAARHPYAYLPFGEGPRNCIGLRFGKMQVKIGLITILEKFDILPLADTPDKLSLNPQNIVPEPIGGIHLNVVSLKV